MPPAALIGAEYDALHLSSVIFAEQLTDAGVASTTHIAKGMIHGHLNWGIGADFAEGERRIQFFADFITGAIKPAQPAPIQKGSRRQMNRPLPRNTPSQKNVDAQGITSFIEALETTPNVEPHSIMLLRCGSVIAEGWWAPYSQDGVQLLYSLSKTFTSTAIGFAVEEGLLNLDDTVLSHFPELDNEITDPRMRALQVGHVLTMASGHREDTWERAQQTDPTNALRGFLLTPQDSDPGTIFAYNQPCTLALAAILQEISGQSLVEFLRPRLFDPLGIGEVAWLSDDSGRQLGFSGMFAQTDAIARLGQFYLQRGRWDGRQLLSASWIDQATSKQVSTETLDHPDWQQGYGFQLWMSRHGYRGDGVYGQFCVVLPEHDAVLAFTGQSLDMDKVLALAWEHLVPAFDRTTSSSAQPKADLALVERLVTLALPPRTHAEHLPSPRAQVFEAAPGNDQPHLVRIELRPDENARQWELTLIEGTERIIITPGLGTWKTTPTTAASAGPALGEDGTTTDSKIAVDVIFLETPHRLHLVLDPINSTFSAKWATTPLHQLPLHEMCSPKRLP
ncbi:serine hydrolase [Arthrobacter sp. BE255]|uniref:serine hydrolase n=1 Tax=Arthrobacter sp. BE255 TaxID=2817721 RepID=UPI002864D341|nr:serine hydrolase [Arthrobacter sp. BE255]MDR7159168.1 CubicO group peptidase (beta-lactamase class C family) [Arthrobacter sp. BE255]